MVGLVELKCGDWLFARDKDGNGDAMQDMLQVLVCWDPYVARLSCVVLPCSFLCRSLDAERHALMESLQPLLGDRTQRTNGKAAFEAWAQARRIRPGDRAYPFGCLVQQPTQVEAPTAAFKIPPNQPLDDHQKEIKSFVAVRCAVAFPNAQCLQTLIGRYRIDHEIMGALCSRVFEEMGALIC